MNTKICSLPADHSRVSATWANSGDYNYQPVPKAHDQLRNVVKLPAGADRSFVMYSNRQQYLIEFKDRCSCRSEPLEDSAL